MPRVPFRVMAAVVVLAPAPAPAPAADAPAGVVVLRAARLFDGRGDTALRDGVVVIEGTTIKAVGSGIPTPRGARVIDLGDVTLLPGFIDAHTHVTGESSDNWLSDTVTRMRRSVPESAIRATERIAVAGDPLADIKATEEVVFVMRGGMVHRHDAATPAARP